MLLRTAFLLGLGLNLLVNPRAKWTAAVAPGCRLSHLGCSSLHVLGGSSNVSGTAFNHTQIFKINQSQCFVGPSCSRGSAVPIAVGAYRKGTSNGVDGGRQSKKGQPPQKDKLANAVKNERRYGKGTNGDGVGGFGRHYPDDHGYGDGGGSTYRSQGGRPNSYGNSKTDYGNHKGKYGSTIGSYMPEINPRVDTRSTDGRGQNKAENAKGRYNTRNANTRQKYNGKGDINGKFSPMRYEPLGPGRWNQGRKSGNNGEDRWLIKENAGSQGNKGYEEQPYGNRDRFLEPHVYESAAGDTSWRHQ
ncbi:membrane protein, putative [Babesia ovata]|uniref:Membrane protein, putative n=1 Tax=Babesia ovata TaxID=189622 RepID=A0A2H6K9N5_9APIC|nr:uncharacterized protein BOVATA_011880 [Babesia ovata]GBE59695.1 membrane protein, putative [Babesia ovata]